MKKKPPKKPHAPTWVLADYRVPAHIAREIGRIIVRWAHLEYRIQRIIWLIAGVDEKYGRVAVKEPRMQDRITMIELLAEIRGIELPEPLVKGLKQAHPELNRWRDLLAHGVWGQGEVGWKVQQTKGKYDRNDIPHSREKRIDPEGVTATVEGLQSIVYGIEIAIRTSEGIWLSVKAQLEASHQRLPEQSQQVGLPQDSSVVVQSPRRRSSRGSK